MFLIDSEMPASRISRRGNFALIFAALSFAAIAVLAPNRAPAAAASAPAAERDFEFTYEAHIPAASAGDLRLWIPEPVSSPYQQITNLHVETAKKHRESRDAEYGNHYAYVDVKAPYQAFDVKMTFDVARHEHRVSLTSGAATPTGDRPDARLTRFLQPDRLVPIDGTIGDLSREHLAGASDNLDKARRAYEYVVATMKYDKTGEGWGHGDAVWACTAKRGNCTDFHSLFIGMLRAAGVPAKFEIGFPLPAGKTSADIPGYHCWAEFYIDDIGWIPVDASEAWKHPDLHDYYFGAHDANRVQFTTGRDIRLAPPQKGELLNYSVYPYAELNGKSLDGIATHFAFRDLSAEPVKTAERASPSPRAAR